MSTFFYFLGQNCYCTSYVETATVQVFSLNADLTSCTEPVHSTDCETYSVFRQRRIINRTCSIQLYNNYSIQDTLCRHHKVSHCGLLLPQCDTSMAFPVGFWLSLEKHLVKYTHHMAVISLQ